MQNAHLRLARLDYVRSSVKTQTSISVHVSHFLGEAEQAHLLSFFGNDAEVGAVTAAIQEGHRFDLFTLGGKKQRIGFGAEPSVYKASISLPRQRRTLRHVVAVSSWLHANGSAGRTFLLNGQEEADAMSWAALVSLQGMPAHPSWAHHVLGNLRAEGKIKPLNGVGCSPAAVEITREELMERMGKARRCGHLPFPADSGPVRWPDSALQDALSPISSAAGR